MNDIDDKLTDTGASLGDGASDVAENLQTRAENAWDAVQDRTDRALRESSAYVRENPMPTVLAAFGFGLILGLLVGHRAPVSFQERYIAEPVHQSKGLLLGLLLAGGTLLRRAFSSASQTAEEMAGNLGKELNGSLTPLRKTARQTARKFGL